jgi:predicted phage-related endonuclease
MLNAEQIKARTGKLTGSRIACLMQGDAEKIMQLWLEMTDDPSFVPEDLSRVWPVRRGECTEQLNLDWFEMKNGTPVTRRGEVVVHPKYDWAAVTLDGFIDYVYCPIEAKDLGGREPIEVIIERYWPQLGWLMECTGTNRCALSMIIGGNEPVVEFIERDDNYIAEMVKRGEQFMTHVANKTPPVVLDAVAAPIDASKIYEMDEDNVWGDQAAVWLNTRSATVQNRDAEKILKSRVPEDAKKCFGHNVQITRDRAGRLSLRELL